MNINVIRPSSKGIDVSKLIIGKVNLIIGPKYTIQTNKSKISKVIHYCVNNNIDILSSCPEPGFNIGENLMLLPTKKTEFIIYSLKNRGDTATLINKTNLRFASQNIFPTHSFICHLPELQSWNKFSADNAVAIPQRELKINLPWDKKKFSFKTCKITDIK